MEKKNKYYFDVDFKVTTCMVYSPSPCRERPYKASGEITKIIPMNGSYKIITDTFTWTKIYKPSKDGIEMNYFGSSFNTNIKTTTGRYPDPVHLRRR